MKTEKELNRETEITMKKNKIEIPFIAYLMSFIVFMVPPIVVFLSHLYIYNFGKEGLKAIFYPLVWLDVYIQFLKSMKEDNINQDGLSKFTYIFVIEILTYGLQLLVTAKYVLDYGWL